jgi:hypothetical protein
MDHCSVLIKGEGLFHSGYWLLAPVISGKAIEL